MPQMFYNFSSGLLSADPGSGGTTLNSAQFATLPVVASPDTLTLTLDPDGTAGEPEIVLVTAHTAAATSVTVTRGQEIGFGGIAGRAHAINTVWRHSITRASLLSLDSPGDTKTTISTVEPLGWKFFGQTLVGADVAYPGLWAVAPAAWKSGSDLVLPSMDDKVAMGGGTLGASGGSNSITLAEANLPPHAHDMSHGHTQDPHNHSISFSLGGAVTPAGSGQFCASSSNTSTGSATPAIHALSGSTGAAGSGTAVDSTPAHVRMKWLVKT